MQGYACNVTNEAEVEKTVAQVVQDLGQIDVLVTCAGIVEHIRTEDCDLASWRKVIGVNLDGTFLFARNVGKHMLQRNIKGSMIFIASGAASFATRPQPQASYNASKAGVKMLATSLGAEWAHRGIRVNSLSPGYMNTPLTNEGLAKSNENLAEQWLKDIPMGKL